MILNGKSVNDAPSICSNKIGRQGAHHFDAVDNISGNSTSAGLVEESPVVLLSTSLMPPVNLWGFLPPNPWPKKLPISLNLLKRILLLVLRIPSRLIERLPSLKNHSYIWDYSDNDSDISHSVGNVCENWHNAWNYYVRRYNRQGGGGIIFY